MLWQFQNTTVQVKGIINPPIPLPDSVKTFELQGKIDADPSLTSIDLNALESAFRFEYFEKKNSNADLKLEVRVENFSRRGDLQTRKDTTKRSYYWFTETITPKIAVLLKDKTGKTLYSQNSGLSVTYRTTERKSEKEARQDFNNRTYDPIYAGRIMEAHDKTLKKSSEDLKNSFDHRTETLYLYAPKGKDPNYQNNIKAAQKWLEMINKGKPSKDILEGIKEQITYFEKEKAAADLKSKKGRHRAYASALNLANIYRCFDDYEQAFSQLRWVIQEDFSPAGEVTLHIGEMKERYFLQEYYRKTGRNYEEDLKKQAISRLDTLAGIKEAVGYLVLNDGTEVRGTILDLMDNFNADKVKLKYEKKLNSPISDAEYQTVDVREIHLEGLDFAVVPLGGSFRLCEVLHHSPSIEICRVLPEKDTKHNSIKEYKVIYFIKKRGERYQVPFYESQIKQLSRVLKDCPDVSQLALYGYYRPGEVLKAILEYDSICGVKGAPETPEKARKSRNELQKNPNFYWGFGSGNNSFTSYFGLSTSFRLEGKTFARLGAGIGFWGPKFSAGLKYDLRGDMRYKSGWSLATAVSHNLGSKGKAHVNGSSGVSFGTKTTTKEIDVYILQSAVTTINISTIYNTFFNRKTAIYAELGFSVPLQKKPYAILPGGIGAEDAKTSINFFKPGGLIIGFGIQFGR